VKPLPIAPPLISPVGVGLLAGAGVLAVLLAVGAFVGYLVYQNVVNGALWFLPSGFNSGSSTVHNNPLHKQTGVKGNNPLAQKGSFNSGNNAGNNGGNGGNNGGNGGNGDDSDES